VDLPALVGKRCAWRDIGEPVTEAHTAPAIRQRTARDLKAFLRRVITVGRIVEEGAGQAILFIPLIHIHSQAGIFIPSSVNP
jgi:hypothetical protein